MDNENKAVTVINASGKEMECEVLFTFKSEQTGKNYIFYTTNELDADGNTIMRAAIYVWNAGKYQLFSITTEQDWNIVEKKLTEMME